MRKDQAEKSGKAGAGSGRFGRRDEVGRSGVYPMSGPYPLGDAPIVTPASWGQGRRGAAGYQDHGDSELHLRQVRPQRCRDIMTKDPVCCLASDTVSAAAQLMRQNDIGILPVVLSQENKTLVGIVTDRDLALKVVAEERDPRKSTVAQVMTRPLVICSPDHEWQKAIHLMQRHQLRRIPQVDNSGRVVGIISQADIALRLHDPTTAAEVLTEISRPAPVLAAS